jgi:anti-sigma regulatory factor (Ser/Thr protein kinase)
LVALGLTLAKVATFVAIALLVGPRVMPWVLRQVARTGSRELFTLCVLSVALGIAFGSAMLFGVSFALGAFFAGMVLSESELSHKAATDSLPLRDAFAVLFFVSAGMLCDPSIVWREPAMLAAVLGLIVAGKSLVALGIVMAMGYPLMHLHDEELEDITTRMRRYASENFENGDTVLNMTIDEKIGDRNMKTEMKRDLFLVFKEIINNIKKHAEAKTVVIEMEDAGKMLFLQIKDDGKGFNPDEVTDRNGIRNIKSRIHKWKGKIKIFAEDNKGSLIIIHLPFGKKSYIKRILGRK